MNLGWIESNSTTILQFPVTVPFYFLPKFVDEVSIAFVVHKAVGGLLMDDFFQVSFHMKSKSFDGVPSISSKSTLSGEADAIQMSSLIIVKVKATSPAYVTVGGHCYYHPQP